MVESQRTRRTAHQRSGCLFRMGCLLIVVTLACLLIANQLFNVFHSEPVKISAETTYITEPLTPDGKRVDYFAGIVREYYPSRMATDDNGFRLLVQRVLLPLDAEPQYFRNICKQLRLDANEIEPDLPYEDPYDYLSEFVKRDGLDLAAIESSLMGEEKNGDHVAQEPGSDDAAEGDGAWENGMDGQSERIDHSLLGTLLSDRLGSPWTLEDLPMMQGWLEKNKPALDVVCEAVQKPVFCIPLAREKEDDSLIATLLLSNDLQTTRALARGLEARANYRIGTGNIDGAIDDILACKRLGRRMGRGVTLIHWLVGIAIEGIADAVGFAGSPQHPPTREQLQRFVNELDQLPAAATAEEKMRFERYIGLDVIQRLSHGDTTLDSALGSLREAPDFLGYLRVDWNVVASRFNDNFDLLAEGAPAFASPPLSKLIFSWRRARSEYLADLLSAHLLPGMESIREAEHRHQCVQRMKRIVVAMLLYEHDHGTLPPAMTVDEQGTPLHSWRVLLLPYLGYDELYKKIRLDEPWNSEYNRRFHSEDVDVYRCPSVLQIQPGQTTYSVVIGPEMPFEAGEGKKLASFGTSAGPFVLVCERAEPVCWMEPDKEIPQAAADAGINVRNSPYDDVEPVANGIASPHPNGANFGCRDAAVRYLTDTTDNDLFQQMLRGKCRVVFGW